MAEINAQEFRYTKRVWRWNAFGLQLNRPPKREREYFVSGGAFSRTWVWFYFGSGGNGCSVNFWVGFCFLVRVDVYGSGVELFHGTCEQSHRAETVRWNWKRKIWPGSKRKSRISAPLLLPKVFNNDLAPDILV